MALALPNTVTAVLAQLSRSLAQQLPNRAVRWVTPDKMHLTLRFLGETAVTQIAPIAAELDRTSANCQPFWLHLHKVGCFPNPQRPRVIWVGLAGDVQPLRQLQQAVERFVVPLGWPQEKRPFQAHLTLGRVNEGQQLGYVQWDMPVPEAAWQVTAVHLIQSQLRPQGPLYTTLHTSQIPNPKSQIPNRKS